MGETWWKQEHSMFQQIVPANIQSGNQNRKQLKQNKPNKDQHFKQDKWVKILWRCSIKKFEENLVALRVSKAVIKLA